MADAVGISPSSVGRIWAEAGLKPHVSRGFKVSNDPMFEEKVTEIVGLCLDPPNRATVPCVDESEPVNATGSRERANADTGPWIGPSLACHPGRGRAATMTHDHKRHGTTTLFAALDVKSGLVTGDCMPRHRTRAFPAFLRRIDRAVRKPP